MASAMKEKDALEKDVAGQYNTFRVYIYMMKAKDATARDAYRALGMSSPSLALLHLDKLVSLGLLEKEHGDYHIASTRRVGALRFFYLVGRWFVPRVLFYSIFFASMTAVFLALTPKSQSYLIPAVVSLLSALVNLYETLCFYRLLPR